MILNIGYRHEDFNQYVKPSAHRNKGNWDSQIK
nr:MAG TPA_asm: hypothetical protein [Caudoviricetes sp.]